MAWPAVSIRASKVPMRALRAPLARYKAGISLAVILAAAPVAEAADWSDDKKAIITEYMQQYRRDWTLADTDLMSHGTIPHTQASVFVEGRPLNQKLIADDGRRVPVEVFGQSVLVDGKDLSGNLGSRTTHGANSPIIENVTGGQIAAGQGNTIAKDTTTSSVSINVSLSIALSVSVGLNLYLLRELRRRAGGKQRPTAPSG